VRVGNLSPRQEGVWAGRIAPRTLKLATYRGYWPTLLPVHVYGRRNWSLSRSGPFRRDKLLALLGIESRLVVPTARILFAIPTEVSGFLEGAETVDVQLW
jgi:hypothetical protein